MTDIASDVPAQPGSASVADTAARKTRAAADKAAELAGEAKEKLGDMAEAAGDALSEAAGKAGAAITDAADKAGEAITEATQHAITRLRNNAELPSERGVTSIANEVVEKVAGIAAREVPGVYDLGGDAARVFSEIRERLHLGEESKAQGVSVRLAGKQAEISVTLVLEYGFVVSSVTDKVREKVISSVEALLELDVTAVDILVDDIHVDGDGKVGDDILRAADYDTSTKGVIVGTKAPAVAAAK
jgi:uncharacterized alkaline shock family protein YloU/uncharacterized protein YjbJ (UPF0337 family)